MKLSRAVILSIVLFITIFASDIFAMEANSGFTGNVWLRMSKSARLNAVKTYIASAKKDGVTIKKQPVFYCKKLDRFYEERPELVNEPVSKVLKTTIIIQYDWSESGVDKDKLAKEWLGEDLYQANKKRRENK